jgi:hypothetical protein
MNVSQALLKLRPGAQWSLNGDDYEGLQWLEPPVWEGGQKKPTREEVESEIELIKKRFEDTEYQRLREKEYPDFKQYLDGIVKGDQEQIQAYIDKCLAVKAKYPKPEGVE